LGTRVGGHLFENTTTKRREASARVQPARCCFCLW